MKILHVLAQLPEKTGSGVYYCNVIKGLGALGHDQRAVYACQGVDGFDLLEAGHCYPVAFQSADLPFAVPGMSDVMPYESSRYCEMDPAALAAWQRAFSARLAAAEREFDPDAVIFHHLWMLTSLGAQRFPRAVKIGVCHNTDLRQARQNPRLMADHVTHIHKLDGIFSLSDAQKQVIARMYGVEEGRMRAMGGAFDGEVFYPPAGPPPTEGGVGLVYAAKISAAKGIYSLVQAYKMARGQDPYLRLDIIGTPQGAEGARLAKAVAGAEGVTLYPAMAQGQLADHLRRRHVFVMPSFFEGVALTALESLVCGLRVVCTETEALMALLGDAVNQSGAIEYVPPPRLLEVDRPVEEDLPAFEAALCQKLLLQAGRARKQATLPDGVLKKVEAHAWSALAKRMEEEIRAISIRN